MDEIIAWLEKHEVFASLEKDEQERLARLATRRELKKGEFLAMQGEIWPFLFLVVEGGIDAAKISPEGRNLLVTSFGVGELFWGLAFFQDEAPMLATLEANARARVYLWSREIIYSFFSTHGQMGWELCRVMIQRMQRASNIVEELAFQPVAGRLARLLLNHFRSAGEESIDRALTLDEMAARVGTTREMVCRALYRFADKKLIEVTRTEFVLTDWEGLKNIAGGV